MKVYVYGGYLQHGGTYMAYQLGRICHEKFGLPVIIVDSSLQENGYFEYDYLFPSITIDQMMDEVSDEDLFICNPSFSKFMYGLRLNCKKLMYIQHINTFEVLDLNFDFYVCVSTFVRGFIEKYYQLVCPVISAYINHEVFTHKLPWNERSDEILVLNHKQQTIPFLEHVKKRLYALYPDTKTKFKMINGLRQEQLARELGSHKFYLTLTPMEGFGLPALEAMASGCVVLGFDAYGGRDYFKSGENSLVVPYGQFDEVIKSLRYIEQTQEALICISDRAEHDAGFFSRSEFDNQWSKFLGRHVLI